MDLEDDLRMGLTLYFNGPPPGYKSNDIFIRHCLEKTFGLNYKERFYVKTSKFRTMSKVLHTIYEGTHDPSRYKASSKIMPYFR